MSKCRCSWCVTAGERRDFRQGAVPIEDFDDEIKYQKPKSGDWRSSKKNRACKKSKTGEKCVFTVKKVIGTYKQMHYRTKEYYNVERTIMTCERCGKYDYSNYRWSYLY